MTGSETLNLSQSHRSNKTWKQYNSVSGETLEMILSDERVCFEYFIDAKFMLCARRRTWKAKGGFYQL
ncbi:hypothetical protein Bca4012_064096 [Brassica carinata]